MKKIKSILVVVSLVLFSWLLSGCGANKEDTNSQSVAVTLSQQFKEEINKEKDIEKIANKIAQNDVLKTQMDVVTLSKDDYISGFLTEIKGFDKVVTIRPMIGTIPFLAYIFEVKNAEEFASTLKSNADLRWNICTEADDMEVAVVDNYVFFVMSPTNFDEE